MERLEQLTNKQLWLIFGSVVVILLVPFYVFFVGPQREVIVAAEKRISNFAQQLGLDVRLWKRSQNVYDESGLYQRIPVDVELVGGYHNVGYFLDRISKLERIVNIEDIQMAVPQASKQRQAGATGEIVTQCRATTFGAVDPEVAKRMAEERKEQQKTKAQKK